MIRRSTLLTLLVTTATAQAHRLGESYLFLSVYDDRIEGRVEIPLAHLDAAIGLKSDRDGKITEGELEARIDAARNYVAKRIGLVADGAPLSLTFTEHSVLRVALAQYGVFSFRVDGLNSIPSGLEVRNALMFDIDPTHRSLLIVEFNQRTGVVNATEAVSLVFESHRTAQALDLSYRSDVFRLLAFVGHGVWFCMTELNHTIMLSVLLLPTVLVRGAQGWAPVSRLRSALVRCAAVVLLFSASHAVGLLTGVSSTATAPPDVLNVLVVAAIVLTGLLIAVTRRDFTGLAAAGLGWIFGLASVPAWTSLAPAYGSTTGPLYALGAGVGLGAAVVAGLVIPILFKLRTRSAYARWGVPYGCVILSILAIVCSILGSVESTT